MAEKFCQNPNCRFHIPIKFGRGAFQAGGINGGFIEVERQFFRVGYAEVVLCSLCGDAVSFYLGEHERALRDAATTTGEPGNYPLLGIGPELKKRKGERLLPGQALYWDGEAGEVSTGPNKPENGDASN